MSTAPQYLSLTLLNWNGFFARTFALDRQITTLSGGNGTGKSTILSAFLAAMVPDLSLLQFRNSTDVQSAGHSRDKGLYGKLNLGECYALIRALSFEGEEILFGVHLQRQAAREGKVQLRSLIIPQWPSELDPVELFSEALEDGETLRIHSPAALQKVCHAKNIPFKFLPSIADYHHQLFSMGLLPKSFRAAYERGQFYRLLQASLYGGVPSTILHSLKSYLLPEQLGLRAAFKELETALCENRITLLALKETEKLQALFSSLLEGALQYLGAEHGRAIQLLRKHRQEALHTRAQRQRLRLALLSAQRAQDQLRSQQQHVDQSLLEENERVARLSQQRDRLTQLAQLETELKENDHTSQHHQEALTLVSVQKEAATKRLKALQLEGESLQNARSNTQKELADQQLALDARQVRALQYQQAHQLWIQAHALLAPHANLSAPLSKEPIQTELTRLSSARLILDQKRIELEQQRQHQHHWQEQKEIFSQKLCKAVQALYADPEFEELQLEGSCTPLEIEAQLALFARALQRAQSYTLHYEAMRQESLKAQSALERHLKSRNSWEEMKRINFEITAEPLPEHLEALRNLHEHNFQKFKANELRLKELNTSQAVAAYQQEALAKQKIMIESRIHQWEKAKHAKEQLAARLERPLNSIDELSELCASLRDQVEAACDRARQKELQAESLRLELQKLSQPYPQHLTPAMHLQLRELAELLHGTPLMEFLATVPLQEAQQLSALLDPYQTALVVEDVMKAQESLEQLSSFDFDTTFYLFPRKELLNLSASSADYCDGRGVWVNIALLEGKRYTPLPQIPWVGEQARQEKRAATASALQEVSTQLKEVEKELGLTRQLSDMATHFMLRDAQAFFESDSPLEALHQLTYESRALHQSRVQNEQSAQALQLEQSKLRRWLDAFKAFNEEAIDLFSQTNSLDQTRANAQQAKSALLRASAYKQWFERYSALQPEMMKIESLLCSPFAKLSQSECIAACQALEEEQKTLLAQEFLLNDLLNRWEHLSFAQEHQGEFQPQELQAALQAKVGELEQALVALKAKLEKAQLDWDRLNTASIERQLLLEKHQGMAQVLLKNVHQLRESVPLEFQGEQELQGAQILTRLEQTELKLKHLQRERDALTQLWAEKVANATQLTREVQSMEQDHLTARRQLIQTKLHFIELQSKLQALSNDGVFFESANLKSEEQLRQIADEAVGKLRELTQHYPALKEALKQAQDSGRIEQKILFFSSILTFLRQRIRKDLLQTHDPFQALKTMQFELKRLEAELHDREKRLKLSTQGIAQLIQRSIQREKYRIEQLNRALAGIGFGQISGIRLHLRFLSSHQEFLQQLSGADQLSLFSESLAQDSNAQQSFLERLGSLYCKMVPSAQQNSLNLSELGEKLLDYRTYLSISVEIQRQSSTWMLADLGALSTGEAIGVGLTLLLLIVQSWEEETSRLRGQNRPSCRILALDEAARLDATSIATLFELCQKLNLQLLLAAPETLQTTQGTTYQLRRIYVDQKAHVHVIGLRAAQSLAPLLPEPTNAQEVLEFS